MQEIKKPELSSIEKKKVKELYNLLYTENRFFTKSELIEKLEIQGTASTQERKVRMLLSKLGYFVLVISTSQTRGYKVAQTTADFKYVDEMKRELQSRVNELESKINTISYHENKLKKI